MCGKSKDSNCIRGKIIAPGFGAGDCRENCGSHLLGIQKDGFQDSLEKHLRQALSGDLPYPDILIPIRNRVKELGGVKKVFLFVR